MPPERPQFGRRFRRLRLPLLCAAALGLFPPVAGAQTAASGQEPPASSSSSQEVTAPLPKGQKLVLTDGTFQVVREYQRNGDRVRYYSLERSDWEEIPAALVDWDATQKAEADRVAQKQAVLEKIKAADQALLRSEVVADSSYEARPGMVLPDKAGFYAVAGKELLTMEQSLAVSHVSKMRTFEIMASGMPMIPTKHIINIPGKHAKIRIHSTNLEFYFRPADGREPIIELLRTDIQGDNRLLQTMSTNMGGQNSYKETDMLLTQEEAARGLYRYTVEQKLPAGEYAIVEKTHAGDTDLYVWDFGMDVPTARKSSASGQAKK